jgi:hypothetical protein
MAFAGLELNVPDAIDEFQSAREPGNELNRISIRASAQRGFVIEIETLELNATHTHFFWGPIGTSRSEAAVPLPYIHTWRRNSCRSPLGLLRWNQS